MWTLKIRKHKLEHRLSWSFKICLFIVYVYISIKMKQCHNSKIMSHLNIFLKTKTEKSFSIKHWYHQSNVWIITSDTDAVLYSFISVSFALESKMQNFLLHFIKKSLQLGIIPLSWNNLMFFIIWQLLNSISCIKYL